jgi:hypothetical protein
VSAEPTTIEMLPTSFAQVRRVAALHKRNEEAKAYERAIPDGLFAVGESSALAHRREVAEKVERGLAASSAARLWAQITEGMPAPRDFVQEAIDDLEESLADGGDVLTTSTDWNEPSDPRADIEAAFKAIREECERPVNLDPTLVMPRVATVLMLAEAGRHAEIAGLPDDGWPIAKPNSWFWKLAADADVGRRKPLSVDAARALMLTGMFPKTRANRQWLLGWIGKGKDAMPKKARAADLREQRKARAEAKAEAERASREAKADRRIVERAMRKAERLVETWPVENTVAAVPMPVETPKDKQRRAKRRFERHVMRKWLVRVVRAKP